MVEVVTNWWVKTEGVQLAQGDYLTDCEIPLHPLTNTSAKSESLEIEIRVYDCVVITQTCDLDNDKAPLVAVCPAMLLPEYEKTNSWTTKSGNWDNVRKGRVEGLHLLSSPLTPGDNRSCLVVDFREIYSLPKSYLKAQAKQLGKRWRLRSPYLEHLSQSFARFFMRVGLPSSIPEFR